MAYADLDSIHIPAAGNRPPAGWGLQVNANFDAVYDDVLSKLGAWTSYTPTLTQAGTVTKTVTYARYIKLGRMVTVQAYLVVTGSGSSATLIEVTLPFTAAQSGIVVGNFYIYDAAPTPVNRLGAAVLSTTGKVAGILDNQAGYMGAAGFTAALASSDSVLFNATYESAS